MVSPDRHADAISRVTLTFAAVSAALFLLSGSTLWALVRMLGRDERPHELTFPIAFVVTSVLLFAGSVLLRWALEAVRQEHQAEFRRWLALALLCAGLFMGVQSYALWAMFGPPGSLDEAQLGLRPFLIIIAALHAAHFLVASLFVSFIAARAWSGRYDHEYHWGVLVCELFWRMLGVIWMVILGVFTIALNTR